MIRDRNIDQASDAAKFALETVILQIIAGASLAAVIQAAWRAPYAGKIIAAHIYCATITDADDSVRLDLRKDTVSQLGATVDPVAADTLTALTLTSDGTFAAGAKLQAYATTGVGDAFVGSIQLVVRPLLGTEV